MLIQKKFEQTRVIEKEFSETRDKFEQKISNSPKNHLIEKYKVHGYIVSILKDDGYIEYSLDYGSDFFSSVKDPYDMSTKVKSIIMKKKLNRILKFNEIHDLVKNIIANDIKIQREFSDDVAISILFMIIGLNKIGPLLLDPRIDEIFLVPRDSNLYIDHAKWGRCRTKLHLDESEKKALINRIRIENDLTLTKFNPSLKGELRSDLFHVRVTLDIHPLSIEGTCFNIRKFKKNRFSLHSLCQNNTIDYRIATFLIFSLISRSNITVFGPPASGKTTLLSGILEYLPFDWRLISIEDVIETFSDYPKNQIRFKVDPFEKEIKNKTKEDEVIKLLHRSPDFLNLGEISTPDHSKALFQALSTGIPSVQTIHGKDITGLLLRMKEVFDIPETLVRFSAPHVFIHIDLFWSGSMKIRRVVGVYEIKGDAQHGQKEIYDTIAYYNPIKKCHILKIPIENTNVFSNYISKNGLTTKHYMKKINDLEKTFLKLEDSIFDTKFLLENP
ncbi:MAG: ATPase, T2SS/T4P/T4SS family [Candidatus Hodarchaeales archaeon]